MKLSNPKSSRGDTIVEVLIGIVLLGSAIGLATVSANHNFQVGVDSTERERANNIAQSQIEFIRNAYNTTKADPSNTLYIDKYKTPNAFCILKNGEIDLASNPSNQCKSFDDGEILILIYWAGAASNALCPNPDGSLPAKTFSINACWNTAANGQGKSQLTLYYKLP